MEGAIPGRRTSRRVFYVAATFAAVVLLVPVAAQAAGIQGPAFAWSTNGTFDYGAVYPGQTASQTFTLTNVGFKASGMVTVALSGSASFTKTADTCTGTSLGPTKSCSVTVQFAPVAFGQAGTGTLYASSKKANGSLILIGPPNLHLSPGTLAGSSTGTNSYNYSFGLVASATQTFTVTNDGNGTTFPLTLVGADDPGFSLANGTCGGNELAPAGTCTFDVSFTAPAACSPGEPFGTTLDIRGQNTFIQMVIFGFCPG